MTPAFNEPSTNCKAPQITTENRKASNEGIFRMAAATMAVRPAAGPLTLSCEPLSEPTTSPPTKPAIRPLNKGALEARAMPKQSGNATKKTTIDEGRSLPKCFKLKPGRFIEKDLRSKNGLQLK